MYETKPLLQFYLVTAWLFSFSIACICVPSVWWFILAAFRSFPQGFPVLGARRSLILKTSLATINIASSGSGSWRSDQPPLWTSFLQSDYKKRLHSSSSFPTFLFSFALCWSVCWRTSKQEEEGYSILGRRCGLMNAGERPSLSSGQSQTAPACRVRSQRLHQQQDSWM